jgi:hypothetical protein
MATLKRYAVTIEARVSKVLTVNAETPAQADDIAHEEFNVCSVTTWERYEQNTVGEVREVATGTGHDNSTI